MSLTYATWRSTMLTMLEIDASDADWATVEPSVIDAAELRCYREVDFQYTTKIEKTTFAVTSPANALLAAPADMLICRTLDYFAPVGTDDTNGGTRHPLEPRDESWIKDYWPNRTLTDAPTFYCIINPTTILVAPTPDNTYTVEMSLTWRPLPLSATNTTTFLTLNTPDLFLYAALIFATGYIKNFGSQSDQPQMAMSWEQQYQIAKASAVAEERRKKSQNWQDQSDSNPPRGIAAG